MDIYTKFETEAQAGNQSPTGPKKWAPNEKAHATVNLDPKRAIGDTKASLAFLPMVGVWAAGEVMRQGAKKYGPYNFRDTKVLTSVYYDAINRHLTKWWDGEDCDTESKMPHLAHIIANCALLLDGFYGHRLTDDRRRSDIHLEELLVAFRRAKGD